MKKKIFYLILLAVFVCTALFGFSDHNTANISIPNFYRPIVRVANDMFHTNSSKF